MNLLGALLLLVGAIGAQEGPSGERERAGREDRIEALERRIQETEDLDQKERLRAELEGLRRQASRLRDSRRPGEPAVRERLRARVEELRARLREDPDDAQAASELGELLRRLSEDRSGGAPRGEPRPAERGGDRPPGPPWGGPGWGRERRFRADTEERPGGPETEGTRAWLRDFEPETFRHLMRLEEEGRFPEVQDLLRAAEGRRREVEDLRRRDPAAFEKMREMRRLERETMEMGDRLRQSPPGPSREEGIRKLNDLLNRLFDLREEARAREVKELKRRIEELERSLSARRAAKERIVERRRRELLGETVDEDW